MKFKYLSTPLLFSALLFSACSSANVGANLKSLIKETTDQDLDLSESVSTSEGKKNLISSLKKSYETNPSKTASVLLNAWKQSVENGQIESSETNWTNWKFP